MPDPSTLSEQALSERTLSEWTLHGTGEGGEVLAVPARTPGCVLHDLVLAGQVPDPRQGDLEASVRWVGHHDWRYETTVSIEDDADHHELVFEGLDTVATISWDGVELGRTRNMHRRYRFDLAERGTRGEHALVVEFASPEREAAAAQQRLGRRPNAYDRPFEAIRKAAYTFGWDWGPDFPSAGLHRPARLESWSTARLGDVRVHTRRDGDRWQVEIHADVVADTDVQVTAGVLGAEATADVSAGSSTAVLTLEVENPALWWPHTHGEPVLHELVVRLHEANTTPREANTTLASRVLRIGFREIVLDTPLDEAGRAFGLRVNGEPVFVRGLNWIPDTCFPGVTTDIEARLDDATQAHQNLIRVWGGGFFESDAFYAACDERGLLVWQDFLFACAAYAEEPELADEVAAETRDNVSRLQHHASLALWNGNNENLWGFEEWWSDAEIGGRTWGLGYYTDLLPRVVAELDPTRPYWPGSPASAAEYPARTPGGELVPANDDLFGCRHLWTEWNDVDHEHYLTHRPRFVSEFGYQAPPAWATMTACLGREPSTADDQVLAVHQKAEGGADKLERGLLSHGGPARSMDEWWWRTQHLQAAAVRTGVGHLRALAPHCQGAIWWQLNDCWPVISWAVVDAAGRRKPAWFALRETSADRIVTILGGAPDGSPPEVAVVNDSPDAWSGTLVVERLRLADGERIRSAQEVTLPPRSTLRRVIEGATGSLLRAHLDDVTSPAWFAEADRTALGRPEWDIEADQTTDGWELTVTARSLVVDLTVLPDRLDPDAQVDTALVSLLPGEQHTFTIRGARDADPSAFTRPPVLVAVNT